MAEISALGQQVDSSGEQINLVQQALFMPPTIGSKFPQKTTFDLRVQEMLNRFPAGRSSLDELRGDIIVQDPTHRAALRDQGGTLFPSLSLPATQNLYLPISERLANRSARGIAERNICLSLIPRLRASKILAIRMSTPTLSAT